MNFLWGVILLCFSCILLGLLVGDAIGESRGYKKGQIDALTGNVRYELRVQNDSTRVWVKIPEKIKRKEIENHEIN